MPSVLLAFAMVAVVLVALRCLQLVRYQWASRIAGCGGPKERLLFGNLFEALGHADDGYDWMVELQRRHGPYQLYIPGQARMLIIDQPKDVECVLKTSFDNFEKGAACKDRLTELLGHGIFNSDGKQWYEQRKTAVHLFSVRQFRDHSLVAFLEHGRTMVELFRRHLCSQSSSNPGVDAQAVFYKYTLDSIGTIGFGKDLGCLRNDRVAFADAFDFAQTVIDSRFFTAMWPFCKWLYPREWQFRRAVRLINTFAFGLVDERSRMGAELESKHDFLSLFMAALRREEGGCRSSSSLTGHERQYLRDVVMNFLIAGRDTTAGALTWTTWRLSQHPDTRQRCREEILRVLRETGESVFDVSYETVWRRLPYAHAVVHEVLRLHPSVPKDGKYCVRETTLPESKLRVPAGTLVGYSPYSMGRMAQLWGPDPERFDPERWLDRSGGGDSAAAFRKRDQFDYPVFNAGPRLCLGMDMAVLELKVALVVLLSQEFDLDVVAGHQVCYLDSLTMPMKFGLRVWVRPQPAKRV